MQNGYLLNGKWVVDPTVHRVSEVYEQETRKPYRIVVFADRFRPVKQYKRYTAIEKTTVAWFGWTEKQAYREARLPSAGSFLYPGIHAVRRAAMAMFEQSGVRQVQIRTNQDQNVYLWNKHLDGSITGYRPEKER